MNLRGFVIFSLTSENSMDHYCKPWTAKLRRVKFGQNQYCTKNWYCVCKLYKTERMYLLLYKTTNEKNVKIFLSIISFSFHVDHGLQYLISRNKLENITILSAYCAIASHGFTKLSYRNKCSTNITIKLFLAECVAVS